MTATPAHGAPLDPTDWRSATLTALGRVLLAASLPIITFGWLHNPSHAATYALLMIAQLALLPAAFRCRLSLRARGIWCVAGLLVVASASTFKLGPVPGSQLVFALAAVLATLVLGMRAGLVTMALNAALFLVLGGLRRHHSAPELHAQLLLPGTWVRMTATITATSSVLVLIVGSALRRLESSLAGARAALDQARQDQQRREAAEAGLRESEARRRADEAALEASRLKTAFLATMAHEIRTPLNAVLGFTHLAMKTALSPKQTEYLSGIGSAGQALLEVINDVLDLSKIEAGRLTLEAAPFRLSDVLGRTRELLSVRAAEKGVALRVTAAAGIPPLLRGDPARLSQVLLNLAANGLKFTDSGEVAVSVSLAARDGAGVTLAFKVRDTGIGMNEEQRARLFEPFAQADESIARQYGGTGLGLAISQRIVNQMGGHIEVGSAPGRGSVFSFTVPFGVAPDACDERPPAPSPSRRPLAGARLLVVEDVDINRQIARELLEAAGATVELAADGIEATGRFAGGGPPLDAIVMDVQMPRMGGCEATRIIREHAGGQAIAIVALSAHALPEERSRCLEAGMNAYVTKPFDPDELAAVLLRLLPRTTAAAQT